MESKYDFSYKNIISNFFLDDGQLISRRGERIETGVRFVLDHAPRKDLSQKLQDVVKGKIASLELTFHKRWNESKANSKGLFEQNHERWLHTNLKLPPSIMSEDIQRNNIQQKKTFNELSQRQKNRRADEICVGNVQEMLLASVKAAQKSNKKDLEFVLRLLYRDQNKATKIREMFDKAKSLLVQPKKIDSLRALTFLLDNRLTTAQYTNMRLISKEHGSNVFPSYNKVAATKKECRPLTKCEVNDVSATLSLQNLMNHTASRLLFLQEPVIETLKDAISNDRITVKLQVKWGCDGSSDYSRYNQKYDSVEHTDKTDGNFFATTVVPLRMTTMNDNKSTVIWNNAAPQSPHWCRPLRLHFAKETDEFVIEEVEFVQSEIAKLAPFVMTIAGVQVTVHFELYLTMIDGKTLATITHTKSKQRCCVCWATPKQFNNLRNMDVRFKPKEGTLNYGLSVLHLWIRSFEWLLHVSYRKEIKKWQVRGDKLKNIAKKRKKHLQKRFLEEMHLRVDFPSTRGTGNSNNGNVCRVAFSKPELLSKILEIDETLVKKIRIVLIALSCQLPLDIELFHVFCSDTAEHYVKLYKWFPLPASIHKVLIHSRDILLSNELSAGVLGEDASESCNKLYRHNRQFHARKNSRKNNLEDVFNRALDWSDPIVASFGMQARQNSRVRKNLPAEVLNLLKAPDTPVVVELEEMEEHDEGGDRDTDDDDDDDVTTMIDGFAYALDKLNLPENYLYNDDDVEHLDDNDADDYDKNDYLDNKRLGLTLTTKLTTTNSHSISCLN